MIQKLRVTEKICAVLGRRLYTSWHRHPSNGDRVVLALLGANLGVFTAWQFMDRSFMTRHFTLSFSNLESGRWHTLITHAFSHFDLFHMGTNLIALYFFGRALTGVLPSKQVHFVSKIALEGVILQILHLYVLGGLAAAATDLAWKQSTQSGLRGWMDRIEKRRFHDAPSLGASGAVNSIAALFCCLFPKEIIYLNFFIPVPAFLLGILFVLHDFSSLKSMVTQHDITRTFQTIYLG